MNKKFIFATKETIYTIAVLHLLILLIYVVKTGELVYFNIANILDLQLLFPGFPYSSTVGLVGIIPVAFLFFFFYKKGGKD